MLLLELRPGNNTLKQKMVALNSAVWLHENLTKEAQDLL